MYRNIYLKKPWWNFRLAPDPNVALLTPGHLHPHVVDNSDVVTWSNLSDGSRFHPLAHLLEGAKE